MKIVVNRCHGGFGLSEQATDLYIKKAGLKLHKWLGEHSRLLGARYTTVPREEYEAAYERALTIKPPKGSGPFGEVNAMSWSSRDLSRSDPILVEVVEELGEAANGEFASLDVVEIPDGVEWEIGEYDGSEWVAEKHRTW